MGNVFMCLGIGIRLFGCLRVSMYKASINHKVSANVISTNRLLELSTYFLFYTIYMSIILNLSIILLVLNTVIPAQQ